MELKAWNEKLQKLRSIILKPDNLEESKKLSLELHSMVHLAKMSGIDAKTFEDELWEDLDDEIIKTAVNEKGRTIAYGLWHSARIEDITMNILVADDKQVINTENWIEKINAEICDTGNALTEEQILHFSKNINVSELSNYRVAVGRKTREIIKDLQGTDMKKKVQKSGLERVLAEGAVANVEAANWLLDFWGKKNVAGLILMPCTRHHIVHINESLRAKKKGLK